MEDIVNLIPFYAEALACMECAYKDIDNLYYANRYTFQILASKSEFYNTPFAREMSIQQEVYYKKALGIIEYICQKDQDNIIEEFLKICRKTFKKTYNYFKNSVPPVDIEKYLLDMNEYICSLSGNEQYANMIAAILFASNIVPMNEIKNQEKITAMLSQRWKHAANGVQRISLNTATEETKKQIKQLFKQLPPDYLKIIYSDKETALPYDFLYDLEEASSYNIFSEVSLTKKDIEEVIFAYLAKFNYEIDFMKYFIPAVHIKYLIKAYKKIKKYYFDNNNDELFIKLEEKKIETLKQKEKLNKEKEKFREEEKKFRVIQKRTSRQIEELQEENQLLQKQMERLKQEIDQKSSNKLELEKLREYVYSLEDNFNSPITDDVPEESYDFTKLSAIILGGHPNWQKKMKEKIPSWKYISADVNINEEILKTYDLIIFNTSYVGHPMYEKVIRYVRLYNKKIAYVQNTNIKSCLKIIEQQIEN